MSIEQHFKPYTDENGEEAFLCPPVGTILIVAAALYGDPSETTDKGKNNASLFISRFLGAARRGGFGEIDVLEWAHIVQHVWSHACWRKLPTV